MRTRSRNGLACNSVPFEIMDGPFVLRRRLARLEGAEVSPSSGSGIPLSRVQPILGGWELPNHYGSPSSARVVSEIGKCGAKCNSESLGIEKKKVDGQLAIKSEVNCLFAGRCEIM